MSKFVVQAFGTLHKNILVEAESTDAAQGIVEQAFENGAVAFSMDDYVLDMIDYDVLTPQQASALDGITEEDCETL